MISAPLTGCRAKGGWQQFFAALEPVLARID